MDRKVRLLVCGDRLWTDLGAIEHYIWRFSPACIIEGEANGADSCARIAGEAIGIPVIKFPANWRLYGNGAGPIRNLQMLKEGKPDVVFAFHNHIQNSKGTKNMINAALLDSNVTLIILFSYVNGTIKFKTIEEHVK
jgi:hypothetical protein